MITDNKLVKEYNGFISFLTGIVTNKGFREVILKDEPLRSLIDYYHDSKLIKPRQKLYYIRYPFFGVQHFEVNAPDKEIMQILNEIFKKASFEFIFTDKSTSDSIHIDTFEVHTKEGSRILKGGEHFVGIGFELDIEKFFNEEFPI